MMKILHIKLKIGISDLQSCLFICSPNIFSSYESLAILKEAA